MNEISIKNINFHLLLSVKKKYDKIKLANSKNCNKEYLWSLEGL